MGTPSLMPKRGRWALLLTFILSAPIVGGAAPRSVSDTRRFTVEDSLNLDTLSFSSKTGVSPGGGGGLVAYAVSDGFHEWADSKTFYDFVPRGSHVFVHSIAGGETWQLTEGERFSWNPVVSPDGGKVAFYAWRNDRICICIWNRADRDTAVLDLENLDGRGELIWSPAMDRLYYFPTAYDYGAGRLSFEPSREIIIRRTWEEDPYEQNFIANRQSQLWFFDFDSQAASPLIRQETSFYSTALSPDGHWMAVLEITRRKVLSHLVPSFVRLDLYETRGTKRVPVFENKVHSTPYAWSPDSQAIVYADGGRLHLFSPGGGVTRPLDSQAVSGMPKWAPRGGSILAISEGELAVVDVSSGRFSPMSELGLDILDYVWSNDGQAVYVIVREESTGDQGVYRIDADRRHATRVFWRACAIAQPVELGTGLLLTMQRSDQPENIWRLDIETGAVSPISGANRDAGQYSFGRSGWLRWRGLDGAPLKGIMLFPPDYQTGKRYPVVFWVYESFSSRLHNFFTHPYNLQILTNAGYVVFMPDVTFSIGRTAESYRNSIVPAMDMLVEEGISDGRFGVMGHSFGGFATNIVITQTPRFEAAVSIAGISDWVSYHGVAGWFWREGHEIGQGRLGADLRDAPDAYVRNSPVFHLDKVKTPLLIFHGTLDGGVPFSQAEEMFYGLRHLNKKAVLVGYPGEYHLHSGTAPGVIKDLWQRTLDWFDEHLKAR